MSTDDLNHWIQERRILDLKRQLAEAEEENLRLRQALDTSRVASRRVEQRRTRKARRLEARRKRRGRGVEEYHWRFEEYSR